MTKCTIEEIQELVELYEDAIVDDFSDLSQLCKSRGEFEETMMLAIRSTWKTWKKKLLHCYLKEEKPIRN